MQVSAFDPKGQSAAKGVLPSSVRFARDALECAKGTQALVLMTEWPEIVDSDWEELARRTKAPRLLFDGRNALDPARMRSYGLDYRGVGRGRTRSIKGGPRMAGGRTEVVCSTDAVWAQL